MSTIQTQYSATQDLSDSLASQKKQKEEIQKSHEREVDQLKRSYEAEKSALQDRFEASEQSERLAHYDHLRNLKSQINREERALEQAGNKSIENKKNSLIREEVTTDQEGRKRIEDLKRKFATLEAYEHDALTQARDDLHQKQVRNSRSVIEDSEAALESLRNEKEMLLNQKKEDHARALNEMRDHFSKIQANQRDQLEQEADAIEAKEFTELNLKRLGSAARLSAYEARKNDPFYQIQRFDSEVSDLGHAFSLKVKVPPHERANLHLQANGQTLQLVGVRTSEQEAFEQDRKISSRSHQTFSEKFNVSDWVDPAKIERTEDEAWVVFTIPKLSSVARRSTVEAHQNPASPEIRFAETLPKPSVFRAKSGKGTLG